MSSPFHARSPTRREWLAAGLLAVGLTVVFWSELWLGGGIIGGDLYSYYFPQKQFLVERWREGEFPLWNSLVGHGYPLVGEGQTAPFYPPHLLIYGAAAGGLWSVNTAYNIVQLTHYVLAFLFTWMYLRRIGCVQHGALLGGLVYTYSWFPPRICWEWAIIGGAWFPLTLWCVEQYLRTTHWRYLAWLSVVLGNQMLAGHFNLAFITQVVLAAYVPLRLWWQPVELPESVVGRSRSHAIRLAVAMALGFGLAAVQLIPSWELKQLSQRTGIHQEFDAGYGFIPLWYWKTWAKLVAPWMWGHHEQDLSEAPRWLASSTNKVESQLYFGSAIVVLLVTAAMVSCSKWRRQLKDQPPPPLRGERTFILLWSIIGLFALGYTSGLLLPVTRYIPGFSFFTGPGRWGMVAAWSVAVLAAIAWESLSNAWSSRTRIVLFSLLVAITIGDLMWIGREAGYVTLIPKPPLTFVKSSSVVQALRDNTASPREVRLFCRGPNLVTNLDIASTPTYLGLSPAAYFDAATRLRGDPPFDVAPTLEQLDWLRRAGVTHILSFGPLDPVQWPNTTLIWQGWDRFLNAAWGRGEPFSLYQFDGGRSRVAWAHPAPDQAAGIVEYNANRITLQSDSPREDTLILTDLAYPGWNVTIDSHAAASKPVDGMFRSVIIPAGSHRVTWTYRPDSVLLGAIVSGVALLTILTRPHLRFWHRGII